MEMENNAKKYVLLDLKKNPCTGCQDFSNNFNIPAGKTRELIHAINVV